MNILHLLLFIPLSQACICSPFSGNLGSCCPDNSDKCSLLTSSLECTGTAPVCCTSDFASKCCPANSACTQGCRDSLLGACDCILPRESDYDEQDALYSLVFVAASQCQADQGLNDTWSCTACPPNFPLSEVHVVENTGHSVLLGINKEGVIVVAFRGSLTLEDVVADVKNVVLTDYDECAACKVGLGWYTAVNEVQPGVEDALDSILSRHPNAPIIVTGHSLGAAMAPLFVANYQNSHPETSAQIVYPVYTFGQPRVGNKEFATWFDEKVGAGNWFRVVHHDDPVPHLPPPALGFSHMATEVWYVEHIGNETGAGYYQVCDGSGEDQQCSAGTLVNGEFTDHIVYLDHDIHQCNPSGF